MAAMNVAKSQIAILAAGPSHYCYNSCCLWLSMNFSFVLTVAVRGVTERLGQLRRKELAPHSTTFAGERSDLGSDPDS